MTSIEKLAEAPCLECGGDMTAVQDRVKECPTYHGPGALVPGLWRKCEGTNVEACAHGKAQSHASGYAPWQRDCSNCHGRGWKLIPAVEQIGVLVNWQVTQPGIWGISFMQGQCYI